MDIDQVLVDYVIRDKLPSGGQGDLAIAEDRRTGQTVVIKQLTTPRREAHYRQEKARFQRAGRIVIGHPNVVDPIDCFEHKGEYYIVFPLIDGLQLDIYRQRWGGVLPTDTAVAIIIAVAAALQAIHDRGVIHRDIKPANILIGNDGQVYIIDLGIAKVTSETTITQPGVQVGTPNVMAPEQISTPEDIDHRCDLFALGAVMYELLTGRPIVTGHDPETVKHRIVHEAITPPRQINPAIPQPIERVCMTLLARDRDDRYASAQAAIEALTAGQHVPASGSCSSCHKPMEPGAQFCGSCGSPTGQVHTDHHCLACGGAVNGQDTCPGCNRRFGHTPHQLVFQSGPLSGTVFRIPEGIYVVGRLQMCDRDGRLSRRHTSIATSNGTVQMQDAGSANGTWVGDRPANAPIELKHGDVIRFASNTAIYTNHP